MQLTKQQKVVGVVLGLAVVACAVDRWVLGPDDALAVAGDSGAAGPRSPRRPAARQPRPAVATAATAPEASLGSLAGLATRLRYIAKNEKLDPGATRDAFRPPAAWVGTSRAATPDEMALAARDFQNRRLTAVMRNSGRGLAIVDQKTVAVGQSLDGFTLVTVKERSAVFRRGSQRVELRLPDDVPGGGSGSAATSEKVAGAEPAR